jgi:hypothetical protein
LLVVFFLVTFCFGIFSVFGISLLLFLFLFFVLFFVLFFFFFVINNNFL